MTGARRESVKFGFDKKRGARYLSARIDAEAGRRDAEASGWVLDPAVTRRSGQGSPEPPWFFSNAVSRVIYFPQPLVMNRLGARPITRFDRLGRAQGGAVLVATTPVFPSIDSSLNQDTAAAPRVVIVDESSECREVLHTLLANRGVAAIEARRAREGLELVRRHHPEVIVLDVDSDDADDAEIRAALEGETRDHRAKLVVLGKARYFSARLPDEQCLAKPYHYAPLIRTIERLLGTSAD